MNPLISRLSAWLHRAMPKREDMERNRYSAPFARRQELWRFTRRSVPRGVAIGLLAGYYGGLLDDLLMRVTDVFISVPPIVVMFILEVAGPLDMEVILLRVVQPTPPVVIEGSRHVEVEDVEARRIDA